MLERGTFMIIFEMIKHSNMNRLHVRKDAVNLRLFLLQCLLPVFSAELSLGTSTWMWPCGRFYD